MWRAASLSVVAAISVLGAIYFLLDRYLVPAAATGNNSSGRTLDIARVAITLTGFVGAVLTGVYAYRKQRLAEGDARRADAKQFVSRFARVSDQLGHDTAAVRLEMIDSLNTACR